MRSSPRPGTGQPPRRRRIRSIAAVLVLALTVAACGSTSAGGDEDRDTIRVAVAEEIGDLNPWDFLGQFHAMDLVYEPLVAYGEGGEPEPALAESWETSPDGRTVTFTLRPGVRFHDGTPFDAAAAKFNLEQWAGREEFSFLGSSEAISQIRTPDQRTVELVLSHPYPPLLHELSLVRPVRFVSPASAPEGKYTEPIGTGPWVLDSESDTGATFVRNEEYWGEKPELARVELRVMPDSQTRLSALRAGEVDLIGGGYLSPINAVEAQEIDSDSSLELLSGDADTTMSLIFNPRGPLADRAVREAISLATDVESINEVLYGGTDHVARGLFPPAVPHAGDRVERDYDPEAAAQALEDDGWRLEGETRAKDGTPLELELLLVSDPVHGTLDARTTGQALQDALGKIGVKVELRVVDGAAYFDEQAAGNYDLTFATTYGAPYDPTNTALSFLKTGVEIPIWTSAELDPLVDAAVAAQEPAELDAAYQAIYDELEEEVAFVPITSPPRYYAVRSDVKGFEIPPHEYHLDLTGVTLG
ncbi:ABC transporter substrate-binding protein [Nocardioides sp. GXZ039]|uniref:ABC transporter substrate-binding protein n=1 Tax=Nocardioides sp. GXZ039 TaxID=3136018 RepID=UPI0030F3846D